MKPRLTGDGKKVLEMLKREYGMTDEAALKMMQPGGLLGRMLTGQVASAPVAVRPKTRIVVLPKPKTETK